MLVNALLFMVERYVVKKKKEKAQNQPLMKLISLADGSPCSAKQTVFAWNLPLLFVYSDHMKC